MSRDEVYLRHILDAIRCIESYTEGGRGDFFASSMQQDAVVRQLDFIESWYNPHRRHSALDYLSPVNYERERRAA